MRELIENKRVAIVGNAQSLFDHDHGTEIDSHDTVCRLNRGIQIVNPIAQGSKTDIWGYGDYSLIKNCMDDSSCKNTIHLSRFRLQPLTSPKTRYYVDLNELSDLESTLTWSFPSSGLIILFYILNRNPISTTVYGFDNFASLSAFNTTEENNVKSSHNWKLERILIERWTNTFNITLRA
jgi:hypothetical protein